MKKIFFTIIAFLFAATITAQSSTDPSDVFYFQLDRWEALELIEKQPSLRPYPLPVIEKILETVIKSDNVNESENAKKLYEGIFNRPWKLSLDVAGDSKLNENDFNKSLMALYGVNGDYMFPSVVSAGYKFDFLTLVNSEQLSIPAYRALPYFMEDGFGEIKNYMEVDGNLALNFKNFYVQGGVNHNSFGPFNDSFVLSKDSKHTANISFTYDGRIFDYTEALFVISATSATSDTKYPNKMLMLHSLDFNPFSWLSATIYETVIYGKRFDLSYMIPMLYMVTQGVTGYDDDNIFMGGNFTLRPFKGFEWSTDVYLDDIGFTGLKEYHDIKLRCAAATGVKYVPENLRFIEKIDFNYTMVSPFMYSHVQYENEKPGSKASPNYQIYTTAGVPLATSLAPNSDRISLNMTIKPLQRLKVDFGTSFIRHANVTESLSINEKLSYLATDSDYFATDGSINQHSHFLNYENGSNYMESAWNKFMFLSQPTKEYTFQADLNVGYDFPETKIGKFSVGLGYSFEYIHNYGVGTDMLPGLDWKTTNFGNGLYKNDSGWTKEAYEALDAAIANWKSSFKDIVNHYISINVKYCF